MMACLFMGLEKTIDLTAELWWLDLAQNKVIERWRRKIYNSKRWKLTREYILLENPFCIECEIKFGKAIPAVDVDHIIPLTSIYLSGDLEKAFDTDNLRALCKRCHGEKTAKDKIKIKQIKNDNRK